MSANCWQHLNSRTHRGANVPCPFCKTNYATASGLSHHLETGSCSRAPQVDRETIFRIIRERDPPGLITNKQITWQHATSSNMRFSANDQAWNGYFFECYLCHREFRALSALNQHLESPIHKQKVYHCPNRKCGKEFKALAPLFGHLESESCAFMRFENVQRQIGNVLSGNKLIAFR